MVAPVAIELEYITDASGARVGHHVHSAFIVHSSLETVSDKELMQQIFGKPSGGPDSAGLKMSELSEQDLKDAGILIRRPLEPPPLDQVKIIYTHVDFTRLEKIRLSGVVRMEQTTGAGSTTIAWKLDPQFQSSEKWRGAWTKLTEAQGSQPYMGWGGYLSVMQVSESPAMLLIESRMAPHELPEWFSASNFVRSKLPLATQEGARNFRRKLKAP